MTDTLAPGLLDKMHAWWRAANYLSVGQIYLKENPLLDHGKDVPEAADWRWQA
jgi:xylulose-5-phosphate/fructose-6-phosphate phosphoketolase